jgi:hypothetical protein
MNTPRTRDEYLDLVDQAIFEIEDVLLCAEHEGDPEDSPFSDILPVYAQISDELKKLHADMLQGQTVIGQSKDLACMRLVNAWKKRIPFYDLLVVLNDTHRTGFQN